MGSQASKPDVSTSKSSSSSSGQQDISLSQSLLNKISSSSDSNKPTGSQDIDTSKPHSQSQSPSSTSSSSPPSSSSSTSSSSSFLSSTPQSQMDSSIRSAISSELSRLRKQEADVNAKIQAALQEENLAIEKKWKGNGNDKQEKTSGSGGRSAHALQKELDAVKEKIERHNASRKAVENTPGVKEAREKVVKCYKENPKRTLDCWKDVKSFSEAVEQAERNFIASLK